MHSHKRFIKHGIPLLFLYSIAVLIGCGSDDGSPSNPDQSAEGQTTPPVSEPSDNPAPLPGGGTEATQPEATQPEDNDSGSVPPSEPAPNSNDTSVFVFSTTADGKPTRIKSKLVTTSENQFIYDQPNAEVTNNSKSIGPFNVFHHLKTDSGKSEENGFYRIGSSEGKPYGWLKSSDCEKWSTRFVLNPQPDKGNNIYFTVLKAKQDGVPVPGDKAIMEEAPGSGKTRLAFILAPPEKEEGDDTLYSVLCCDRQVDEKARLDSLADLKDLGMEICFVLEATDGLNFDFDGVSIKSLVTELIREILKSFRDEGVADMVRFGLVEFQDNTDKAQFDAKLRQPLTDDLTEFAQKLDNITSDDIGGDWAEDGLSGLKKAAQDAGWSQDSSKHIIYLGMGALHKHGRGGPNEAWGNKSRRFAASNVLANMFVTTNTERIGHSTSGWSIQDCIDFCSRRDSAKVMQSKTIHTIFMLPEATDVFNITSEQQQNYVELADVVIDSLNMFNDAQLVTLFSAVEQDTGIAFDELLRMSFIGINVKDMDDGRDIALNDFKKLAANADNFAGFHDVAQPTKSDYQRVANDLFTELNRVIPVLKEAKKGDAEAVRQLTGSNAPGASSFTKGSFRTIAGNKISEFAKKPTFTGQAPVRDDDGNLVAHKEVLVSYSELDLLRNKLDGIITDFEKRVNRKDRTDIKELLTNLQTYAIAAATGEPLTVVPESALKSIITDLPLRTNALELSVDDLSVMPRDDFEVFVQELKQSRKRCQDLLNDQNRWLQLSEIDADSDRRFAFIRLVEMP